MSDELKLMVWQAIESAPKDGTRILLTDGKFVATGAWRERHVAVWRRKGPSHEFRWDIDGESGDECPWANDYMGDVIAWMPLPAPPTTVASSERT